MTGGVRVDSGGVGGGAAEVSVNAGGSGGGDSPEGVGLVASSFTVPMAFY